MGKLQVLDGIFDKFKIPIIYSIYFIHIFYIFLFFGFVFINPEYIKYLSIFIQVLICIILIIRFNPYRKHNFVETDSRIIFSSAIFLLTNLGITEYIRSQIEIPFTTISKTL